MNILDIAIAKKLAGGGGGSGTDNYNDLSNLPKINDTTLSGNKTSANLGLQSEINSDSKLASDLVDDTNQDNKFVTSSEKSTWNGKQNAIDADHKINADYVDDSTSTNKFVTATDKETWNAKQNAIDSSHKLSSDLVDDTNHTNKFVTSTEKQTWNGKQNAIDSDHKLSSSLVSFTTAEAAALASGIDSTKVGQISTNQTNILYGLRNGAKNFVNLFDTISSRSCTATELENGGMRLACTNAVWTQYFVNINLKPNTQYVLYTNMSNFSGTSIGAISIRVQYKDEHGNLVQYKPTQTGEHTSTFTTESTTDLKLSVLINDSDTARTQSIDIWVMICEKVVYDTDPSYVSASLPNYDLTRLEAEDRASLAEVVDSGAKNVFNIFTAAEHVDSTITRTINSNGTVTVSNNGTNTGVAVLTYRVNLVANTQYIISGCPSGGSDDSYSLSIRTTNSQPIPYAIDYGSGSGAFTVSSTDEYLVYLRVAANYTFSNKIFSPMICTKAAFGVSQKFVPYQYPSPKIVYANNTSITASTSVTTTGLAFTSDSAGLYRVTATLLYTTSKPNEMLVKQKVNSSSSWYSLISETNPGDAAFSRTAVFDLGVGGGFELFASYLTASSNKVSLIVEKIG